MNTHTTKFLGSVALTLGMTLANISLATVEDFKIEGKAYGLEDGCSFLNVKDGSMVYDETDGTWTTDKNAMIRVKTRNVNNVQISNDGQLRDATGPVDTPISFDYTNSSVNTENARNKDVISPSVEENSYSVSSLTGGNVLNIGINHAVKTSDSFVALNEIDYFVQNTATCTQ